MKGPTCARKRSEGGLMMVRFTRVKEGVDLSEQAGRHSMRQ